MSETSQHHLLFNPEKLPDRGRDFCFLCGVPLDAERQTDEHVIPRWVQDRYDLWNQRLTLLNGTEIPYRQLTIPCCATCNNVHLGRIETEMQQACDAGITALRKVAPRTIFLWASKIVYGLLYREHLLPWDRRAPGEGPIVPKEELERFRLLHQFLQAARLSVDFSPWLPASIFVFETLEPSDQAMAFDYWDDLEYLSLSIRIGKVGIVVCLQDGAAVEQSFADHYSDFQKFGLHRIQFAEVSAQIFYDLRRLTRTPKFLLYDSADRAQVMLMPLGGLSTKPLFTDFKLAEYAKVLSHFTRIPFEALHPEPDGVISWIRKGEELQQMQADDPV